MNQSSAAPGFVRARVDTPALRAGRAYRVLGVLEAPEAHGWDRAFIVWGPEGERTLGPAILFDHCNERLYEAQERGRRNHRGEALGTAGQPPGIACDRSAS